MKCPNCENENPEEAKFCGKCGEKLALVCSKCGSENALGHNFCNECGQRLEESVAVEEDVREAEGERKYVTALFSDLSGYTSMSEKLDPEELKEIMNRVFGEITQVVTNYEGFIEKFVGDAIMALFGVPKAHEDDPIRAIKAAREIHELVDAFSPEVQKRIGQPISMHTGINTGLVVTGKIDMEKGTHGVAGDPLNLASRLSGLAKAGEIVVGPDTYRRAEGYFTFKELEPTKVKGKTEPVQVFKVLSAKESPVTLHRLSGLRSDLIGRKAEIAELLEGVENLGEGNGRFFSICGDAGTGKSRLVEEFKAALDLDEIQWVEGHAYAYAQNIPYFPLIDLLNRSFQIEEGDPPQKIKEKVESGIEDLVGKREDVISYVGSLFGLDYPEVEDVSPEFWKSSLRKAIMAILTALARKAPTVFVLEDLHWADPSFVELLRHTLMEIRQPAIVLCVYRPTFNLFTSQQLDSLSNIYREIRIQDLSPSEVQDMLESLLKSETIPIDLQRIVQDRAEGNPFYLEELVNSLIETETLIRDNGNWKVTRPISESEISSTIHGIISGRLDRLEIEMKRVLQEASVIGRTFLHEILKRITDLRGQCEQCISGLERLDLIRTRSLEPELEYIFKHALTQEVVYKGLLIKDRQEIHERIAQVIEELFHDRLPEFYETLAFHYRRSRSVAKTVEYLVKSGKKSLARYAVEEAHQYFRDAYEIFQAKTDKTDAEKTALIDMLNEWGYVHYYLGDIEEWIDIFTPHKELAESLGDKARLGMFYAWLGNAYFNGGSPKKAYDHLTKALDLGEDCKDQKVIGYACTWLSWSCAELASYDKAVDFGERAQEIAKSFPSDQYLYFKSLTALGYIYWFRGDVQKTLEVGRSLLSHGERHANSRSKVFGHWINALGNLIMGDIPSIKKSGERAIEVSEDPYYIHFGRLLAGLACDLLGEFQEAEEFLKPTVDFSEKEGCGECLVWGYMFMGPALIAQGRMSQGMELLDKAQKMIEESHRKGCEGYYYYILGKTFSLIATGPKPGLSIMAKNIGFLMKKAPFASKKAVEYFNRAIEVSKKIDAKGSLGLAYLDLGMFYKTKKETDKAQTCLAEAIEIFEGNGAKIYLKQAKEALASLA